MSFDFSTLITDRGQSDLATLRSVLSTPMEEWTAEQLAAFNLAASRGAYNYTDLNRVTACMDYLNERLTALGYQTGYERVSISDPPSGLPSGYKQVEYIQATGTQWIDTEFNPNQDTTVLCEAEFPINGSGNMWLFGCRTNNNIETYNFLWTHGNYRSDYATYTNLKSSAEYPGFFLIEKRKNITLLDGVQMFSYQYTPFQCEFSMYIFANNHAGSPQSTGAGKIKYLKIYNDDVLVRDFIPCRDTMGNVGLYDLVGKQFYGNAGSGAFTAGPEVHPPDPYTWYEEDTPTSSQMQQYLANGAALRDALTMADDLPDLPPDMDGLTQAEANDIEALLGTINDYLEAMQRIFLRSGMAWTISGGPNFYFVN